MGKSKSPFTKNNTKWNIHTSQKYDGQEPRKIVSVEILITVLAKIVEVDSWYHHFNISCSIIDKFYLPVSSSLQSAVD